MKSDARKKPFVFFASTLIVSLSSGFFFVRYTLPFELPKEPYSMVLLDRNGAEIGELLSKNGFRHRPLASGDVPAFTRRAVVSLEDRRFFSHLGLDPFGIARAFWNNAVLGWSRQGASTIQSWLVRNVLWIEAERTWLRKIAEGLLALRLDGKMDKGTILAEYLNRISYGRLSKGFAAASRSYFGKEPKNLTEAEQIALLAIAKNPSKYDPIKNPTGFRERFEAVAKMLAEQGVLEADRLDSTLAEKFSFPVPKNALPYVTDAFKSGKIPLPTENGKFSQGNSRNVDGRAMTSFDLEITNRIKKIAEGTLSEIAWRNVSDYSVLVVRRDTKEVLAMLWGADYFSSESGQVNAVFAPRQVGSTIKPFTYLLAFQNRGVAPGDTVLDLPVSFETAEGTPYEPKNFSLSYRWPVTVAEALAWSLNVPAVKMAELVGAPELLGFLRSLGVSTLSQDADHYGLALTLGVGEISLYELLRAYTVFSDRGNFCDFSVFPGTKGWCEKRADSDAAEKIEAILTNRAFKLREFWMLTALDFPDRFVFVKTGTSRNFRDNYAIGYTKNYLIAAWSGNKDGSNMKGVSGATGAGEIFSRIVRELEPPGWAPEETALKAEASWHLEILSPLPKSRYKIDAEIPSRTQILVPKFFTDVEFESSEWALDGNPLEKDGIELMKEGPGKKTLVLRLKKDGRTVAEKTVEFQIEAAD